MNISLAEENYLKAIYHLAEKDRTVQTNAIAQHIHAKASSVTDMLDKLSLKELVEYTKYKGVSLTKTGKKQAVKIIRKHRLWESFLVSKLGFSWENVHEIAEQLEHIQSDELVDRLDLFLGEPKFDPHGDPIPNKKGQFPEVVPSISLVHAQNGSRCIIAHVNEDEKSFLSFLSQIGLSLQSELMVLQRFDFNASIEIEVSATGKRIVLDQTIQNKLMVIEINGNN